MSLGTYNGNPGPGFRWKQYAASGARDLVVDSPDGRTCACRVVLLAAGDLTNCKDGANVDRPLTGLPANYDHKGSTSEVNCTQAFVAYW